MPELVLKRESVVSLNRMSPEPRVVKQVSS